MITSNYKLSAHVKTLTFDTSSSRKSVSKGLLRERRLAGRAGLTGLHHAPWRLDRNTNHVYKTGEALSLCTTTMMAASLFAVTGCECIGTAFVACVRTYSGGLPLGESGLCFLAPPSDAPLAFSFYVTKNDAIFMSVHPAD